MKKDYLLLKNIFFLMIFLISIPIMVFADEKNEALKPLKTSEYTEQYQKWLELPDEEKKNYIEPTAYKSLNNDKINLKSFSKDENIVGTGALPSKFTNPYYGKVKDQGEKSICWACSTSTACESNYYHTTSIKKAFSHLHMDYTTSKQYNQNGFFRNADDGGNFDLALAYATNGMGLVSEASTKGKTPSAMTKIKSTQKVSDFIELNGQNQVKSYIYNFGVVPVYTFFDSYYFSSSYMNNNNDLAYCCNVEGQMPNHGVTLVGWDDNYQNSSFPYKKGAYLALNSHGETFGNKGLYHIFYDDIFVNETLYGITKTNDIDYDNIYQYDEYGKIGEISFGTNIYGSNVFKRVNSQSAEKLTDVSIYLPVKQSVTIYINSNSNDTSIANATHKLTTDVLDVGYHTITLSEPVILNGDSFAIIVNYSNIIPIEREVNSPYSYYYTATSNRGESFISSDGYFYEDLYDFIPEYFSFNYANLCIKAFTKKGDDANKNPNQAELENYLFDYKYYADHNRDLYCAFGYNENALKNHWNNYGKKEGRQASPILNLKFYISNNPDLVSLGVNYVEAYNHFVNFGYAEYRNSSSEYNGNFYRSHNSDLANMSSMELIRHYSQFGKNELRQANTNYDIVNYLFDANIYAKFNQDVVNVFGNDSNKLKEHWYKFGISEGRIASLFFDAKAYLSINLDVANYYKAYNYLGAYEHFINYGFAEGRQGNLVFSADYYLKHNPDFKNVFGNNYLQAVNHFYSFGKNEFRLSSAKFNVNQYKAKNIDLINAFGNRSVLYFEHYIMFGQNENRTCL